MDALTVISKIKTSSHVLSIMGVDGKPTYLHIDNFKTGINSTMTPISDILEALKALESNT